MKENLYHYTKFTRRTFPFYLLAVGLIPFGLYEIHQKFGGTLTAWNEDSMFDFSESRNSRKPFANGYTVVDEIKLPSNSKA